jgi:transcriptional regulator with XRE-family HTH domain
MKPAHRTTSDWTRVEIDRLRQLHADGLTQAQMAEALGRNGYQIQHRLRKLNLTKVGRSKRPSADARLLDIADVKRLMRKITEHIGYGWQSELARAAGIPSAGVAQVELDYIKPGDRLLAALGLRKVVLYEVVSDPVSVEKTRRRVKRNAKQNPWELQPVVLPPNEHARRVTVHRAKE